jgi:hypothetical protein
LDAHAGTSALLGALQHQVPRSNGRGAAQERDAARSIVRNSLAGFGASHESSRAGRGASHDRDCARSDAFSSNYDRLRSAPSQSESLLAQRLRKGTRGAEPCTVPRSAVLPRKRAGEARLQRSARRLENLAPRFASRRARSRERTPSSARFIHPDDAPRRPLRPSYEPISDITTT